MKTTALACWNEPRRPGAARRRRAFVECLEARLAPAAGTISGVVFNDLNHNAAQDTGEPAIAGRTVFLDLNQDNALDNGEPSTTTGADGSYQFTSLQPGTYLVGQILPSGWAQSAPQAGTERQVALTAGSPYTFTFNGLASTNDQTIPAYHENGFTFNTSVQQPTQFTVYGSSDKARYAGSPALAAEWAPSTIQLTHDDGTPFTLTSMDLSTTWSSIYDVTVSFTGTHVDGTQVQQSFAIGNQLGFHTVAFSGFTNLRSVTWKSTNVNDYHQFDNVNVTSGPATSASGVNFGSYAASYTAPVANDDAYSVDENNALATANPVASALIMSSQPGDYIGQGQSYAYTPADGPFTASSSSNDNYVGFGFHTPNYSHWWYVNFAAPAGGKLIPGTYDGAARYPFQDANQPGLSVYGDGRGSNTLTGTFTVNQAIYDAQGHVLSFAASFVQHSEGATPALTGTITYQAPNPPPAGVLANDTDPNALPLTAQLVSGPSHGTLALGADGNFTYVPATNYFGPDSFTYVAADGQLASSPATVNITVNHVNQPPAALDASFSPGKDQALTVAAPGVLAGASDPDANTTLTAKLLGGPAHGTVSLNADGSFTYTPFHAYLGSDSFTYRAFDGALYSNTATVRLTITGPDDPPVATNDTYLVTRNTALSASAPGVLGNDTDPNGQPITALLGTGPAHGTLTLNSNGSLIYTPATDYSGPDSFTYTANDGQLGSNAATVSLYVDGTPVATADSYATDENQTLTVATPGVLGNDIDPDAGDTLRAVLVSVPSHGKLTLNADGSLTYVPASDFYGTDSFSYRVSDGRLSSNTVTDAITVNHVNQPPVAADDAYTVDPGSTLTSVVATSSIQGTSGAVFSYGPNDGTYSTYLIYGYGATLRFAPSANPGYTYTFTFSAPDHGHLKPGTYLNATRFPFQGAGAPGMWITVGSYGSNTMTGQFTIYDAQYDAAGNLTALSADYKAYPDNATTAWVGHVQYRSGNGQPVGLLTNDSDPDNDPLTVALASGPAHGVLNLAADGSFTYTPNPGYSGADSFTYTTSDGQHTSNVATARITVGSPPVVADDLYRAMVDSPCTVAAPGVLANDLSPQNVPLTAALVAGPAHGSVTLNPDGSFVYTPQPNYQGTDTFTYTAGDGASVSRAATVTVSVGGGGIRTPIRRTMTTGAPATAPVPPTPVVMAPGKSLTGLGSPSVSKEAPRVAAPATGFAGVLALAYRPPVSVWFAPKASAARKGGVLADGGAGPAR